MNYMIRFFLLMNVVLQMVSAGAASVRHGKKVDSADWKLRLHKACVESAEKVKPPPVPNISKGCECVAGKVVKLIVEPSKGMVKEQLDWALLWYQDKLSQKEIDEDSLGLADGLIDIGQECAKP